jgi:hypothetical protein
MDDTTGLLTSVTHWLNRIYKMLGLIVALLVVIVYLLLR